MTITRCLLSGILGAGRGGGGGEFVGPESENLGNGAPMNLADTA